MLPSKHMVPIYDTDKEEVKVLKKKYNTKIIEAMQCIDKAIDYFYAFRELESSDTTKLK